jgi:hypothetical protein
MGANATEDSTIEKRNFMVISTGSLSGGMMLENIVIFLLHSPLMKWLVFNLGRTVSAIFRLLPLNTMIHSKSVF